MSKGIRDFQNTVQNYGSNINSLQQYIANYDNEYFQDFREKIEEASKKVEAAKDVASGVGITLLNGKALYKSGKSLLNKVLNKDSVGDEDGDEETPDESSENVNLGTETSEDLEEDIPRIQETSFGSGIDTSGQLARNVGTQQEISDFDPEDDITSLGRTPTTSLDSDDIEESENLEDNITEGAGDVADDVVGDASEAVSSVLGDSLGFISDALGPVGLIAGLGLDIYNLVKDSKKAPAPTLNNGINSSRLQMVLPSYDSVTDTPAAVSAF